jgi:hypothetical protein
MERRYCMNCGDLYTNKNTKFCRHECYARHKARTELNAEYMAGLIGDKLVIRKILLAASMVGAAAGTIFLIFVSLIMTGSVLVGLALVMIIALASYSI